MNSSQSKDRNGLQSLEMETLQPMTVSSSQQRSSEHILDQLWTLLRLYIEYYPKLSTTIIVSLIVVMVMAFANSFQHPLARHRLSHHYAKIDMHYNFRASQIDHWCLFGGDDACQCEDFTEPIPREELLGWMDAHKQNVARIQNSNVNYDIAFLGEDTAEAWNGLRLGSKMTDGLKIQKIWNSTFTKAGGSEFEGISLGIAGDSTANLLWRLQHGEMVTNARVFWLLIGTNDLSRGGCSEEAVVLGILRVAEEIYYYNPGSVVVIQGILPRSSRRDGSLEVKAVHYGLLHKHMSEEQRAEEARRQFLLWPSIQSINQELANFCKEHEYMVYFDAAELFLGTSSNAHFHGSSQHIIGELMTDYVHLSATGFEVLAKRMQTELERIIFDDDESNDIEKPKSG